MKIISCRIENGRFENEVYGTFEDGSEKLLFRYFWDELYFAESEFVGLTEEQAHDLFHEKDIAYLRS